MRISDWSSDVCSSVLMLFPGKQVMHLHEVETLHAPMPARSLDLLRPARAGRDPHLFGRKDRLCLAQCPEAMADHRLRRAVHRRGIDQCAAELEKTPHDLRAGLPGARVVADIEGDPARSEEHTSEFQSLMRTSYAVFCLTKTYYIFHKYTHLTIMTGKQR